jgi:hypothetical protein
VDGRLGKRRRRRRLRRKHLRRTLVDILQKRRVFNFQRRLSRTLIMNSTPFHLQRAYGAHRGKTSVSSTTKTTEKQERKTSQITL